MKRLRTFAVAVSVPNEDFDSDSIGNSSWYGPYTKDEANNMVERMEAIPGVSARILSLSRPIVTAALTKARLEAREKLEN